MRKAIVTVLMLAAVGLAATSARAQSTTEPAKVELAIYPGGGIFFNDADGESDFGSYSVGLSVTYNLNRRFGIEGEVAGNLGLDQALGVGPRRVNSSAPNQLSYNGNLVFYPFVRRNRLVPYVTGGIGGLTLFERHEVGIDDSTTFFTGNAGGGVKYFVSNRWGLRVDYRFFAVASKENAPEFFGRRNRYGHRILGGIILNIRR